MERFILIAYFLKNKRSSSSIKLHFLLIIFLILSACSKEDSGTIPSANSPKPEAIFTASVNADGDLSVTNTSKNGSTYSWDFGDGKGTSSLQNPTYHYEKSGEYIITLNVSNSVENANSTQKVTVAIVQKDISEIDQLILNFLKKYNIPGASLAIMKNEKLVYAKGLGLANKETKESMTSNHRLRIASVSKTYAGLAILKLMEQRKLNINDKVFGAGAILGTKYGTKPYSINLKSITVEQILHNTSGAFVDNNGFQVININEHLSDKDYMTWLLDNSFVNKTPGSAYYYNNCNYFVASIIVEELSRMTFYEYIKKNILDPIGDTNTFMAMNNGVNHPHEAKYYGQGNLINNIYDFNIERYKGGGAIVSNSISLLKFASAFDGMPGRPDIISTPLRTLLRETTALQTNWGLGVGVWDNRTYSYGSLPSTRAGWMIEPSTNIGAAIICNSNVDYTNVALDTEIVYAFQDLLVNIITINRNYQNIDQF